MALMQLRDDESLKPLITFIQENKGLYRGIMRVAARSLGVHPNHVTNITKGSAPYSPSNIRHLRSIANFILKEKNEIEQMVSQTVDSLPAA